MGWQCVPEGSEQCVRFFSVTDEIKLVHDRLFDFIRGISAPVIITVLILVFATFIIYLFLILRRSIRRMGSDGLILIPFLPFSIKINDNLLSAELANSVGEVLDKLIQFLANISYGWIMVLSVISLGFIIVMYFRFFRQAIRSVEDVGEARGK